MKDNMQIVMSHCISCLPANMMSSTTPGKACTPKVLQKARVAAEAAMTV